MGSCYNKANTTIFNRLGQIIMRIGIDARLYGPEQGGLGRYIAELIHHLETIVTDDEFVIFLRAANWDSYSPKNPRFRKVLANIPWYGLAEQIYLPGILKKEKVDLMHFPHWNIPLLYNQPFVTTIHDLLLLHFPTRRASLLGPITYWIKNKMFRRVLNHAVHKARHIFTPSEYTRQDVHKTLSIPLEKISTTYLAPFAQTKTNTPATPSSYHISKPYVLYVGVAYPHKNLIGLLEAWKIFTETYGSDYQLVLVGKHNFFYKELIQSPLARSLKENLVYSGYVPDEDLPSLYTHASLFVMASLYEGFALPTLEALQYGTVVVSSDATCLPEVLRDAALFADAKDAKKFAAAIHEGITNTRLREKLLTNGQKLLKFYSWKQCAEQTFSLYHNHPPIGG